MRRVGLQAGSRASWIQHEEAAVSQPLDNPWHVAALLWSREGSERQVTRQRL